MANTRQNDMLCEREAERHKTEETMKEERNVMKKAAAEETNLIIKAHQQQIEKLE